MTKEEYKAIKDNVHLWWDFFNGQSNALFMKMKNETNIVKGDLQTITEILKRSIKFGEIIQFMDIFAKRPWIYIMIFIKRQ